MSGWFARRVKARVTTSRTMITKDDTIDTIDFEVMAKIICTNFFIWVNNKHNTILIYYLDEFGENKLVEMFDFANI